MLQVLLDEKTRALARVEKALDYKQSSEDAAVILHASDRSVKSQTRPPFPRGGQSTLSSARS